MTSRSAFWALTVGLTVLLQLGTSSSIAAQDKDKKSEKKETKPPEKPAVKIPDKNLEDAIRAVIFEPKGDLNDEKLARVYVLHAQGKSIKVLTGLEKCKNLAELRLTNNQIADVKPLKELNNLQSLDLAKNQIKDVAPLGGLTNLQYLELSNNQIADIAPLKGLNRLTSLYLSGNQLKDIAPVAGLDRLWSLYLAKNQLKDIGPISKLTRLSTLELEENQIESLAPLEKHTELRLLMLDKNKIADLKPLVAAAEKDAAEPSFAVILPPYNVFCIAIVPIAAGPKRFAPFLHLYLEGNPLSADARSTQIAALKKAGVRVFGVNGK